MQNSKEKCLINYLCRECGFNKFTIVEKKDMLSCFDKHIYIDENELDNIIQSLERKGYIKIKYEDENVYCLSVLFNIEDEKKEKTAKTPSLFLLAFVGSFLGGLIGSLIINLIFIH